MPAGLTELARSEFDGKGKTNMRKLAFKVRPMRVFVRPNSAAERGFHARAVMPKPKALAPGLPPTPEHNLIFHGGKTIANLSYANYYVRGANSWNPDLV